MTNNIPHTHIKSENITLLIANISNFRKKMHCKRRSIAYLVQIVCLFGY